ncbi:MAG: DUF368 domain-containing protein [Mycoplasmataceae bacterium]|nr:DUF368 domain-containing protein [Mycoplasmataceae bacterium]
MNKQSNRKNEETVEIELLVSSISSKKGWAKIRELLKWIFTGVFMGSSDAIPGYSGGTTLALLGFFKRLIIVAKSVFVPQKGITRLQALGFMLPFGLGWIGGVFGIAKLTEFVASKGFGLEILFFFSFFVMFAIPIFLKSIKRDSHSNKDHMTWKGKTILIVIAVSIMLAIALTVLFVEGGVKFEGIHGSVDKEFNFKDWWGLILVAYAAGLVTIVPGGSGAIVQLLSGFYEKIHWTIMANPTTGLNFLALAMFAVSTLLGMITMVFILTWFLKKKERQLEMFSLGMLLASPVVLLIIPNSDLWSTAGEWEHIIGILVASLLGASFAISIYFYTNRVSNKTTMVSQL